MNKQPGESFSVSRQRAENYWLKKLGNLKEPTPLFSDFNNFPGETDRKDREISVSIPGDIKHKMDTLFAGKNREASKFLLFITVLKMLYFNYTRCSDIVVGTPDIKFPGLVADADRLLFLRSSLNDTLLARELVKQEQGILIEAFENHDYDFHHFLSRYRSSQLGDEQALFYLGVFYNRINNYSHLLKGFHLLILIEEDQADGPRGSLTLKLHWNNRSASWPLSLMENFSRNYIFTLNQVLPDSGKPVSGIDMIAPAEKERLLELTGPEAEFPIEKTVVQLFEQQAQQTPDAAAMVFQDRVLTFRELNKRTNQLAHYLRDKHQVKPNQAIGLMMERTEKTIIGTLGILKAGAAFLPVDIEYPQKRILHILEDSNIQLLISNHREVNASSFTSLVNIREGHVHPFVTPRREQIVDFDSLPIPDRTLVNYEKYHQHIGMSKAKYTITLQNTRGCPFNCLYCHKIWPKNSVSRSAEKVFDEIHYCYRAGIRRFAFIDDIFNLNVKNTGRLLEAIIASEMDLHLYFPHGLRGDILSRDYIDLLIEAGTVNMAMALESSSQRLLSLMQKKLDLDKFLENIHYIAANYPHVILTMQLLHGFPTESEEEALQTLEVVKNIHWLHFLDLNILKIFPNTDMYDFAIKNGISKNRIQRSTDLLFNELPETLPISKSFTRQYQTRYLHEYFLSKERLLHVLPYQAKISTEDELIRVYDSYLPMKIDRFPDILDHAGIHRKEVEHIKFLEEKDTAVPGFSQQVKEFFPAPKKPQKTHDAIRILLLDLSLLFTADSGYFYDLVEAPLGLMALMTYLNRELGERIDGKVLKSRIDFDSYHELRNITEGFQPHVIGIRTLSYYKDFFHKTTALIRQWGIDVPIIAGGPYATSDFRSILQDVNVDVVVMAEGEYTFAQLINQVIKNNNHLPHEDILEHIPGIAFTREKDKTYLRKIKRDIIFLDTLHQELKNQPDENPPPVNQPADISFVIYTSGSTGTPKGILQTHECLYNVVSRQVHQGNFEQEMRILQFSSISFDVFIAHELFFSLLSGGSLYITSEEQRKNLSMLEQFIVGKRIQWALLPVSALNTMVDISDGWKDRQACLAHIVSAGEQLTLSSKTIQYLQAHARILLHNFYGPSETHNATNYTLSRFMDAISADQPIGRPGTNTRVYILSGSRQWVPIGAAGEIYISGSGLARGYLNNQELTAERFIPNPFLPGKQMYKTGDKARWEPDGNIRFLGRIDDQIKIRGFRVELTEIEKRIRRYGDMDFVLVLAKKDETRGAYLVAYFTGSGSIKVPDLRNYLEEYLPGYMIPSYFMPIEEVPLTPNGKVDRKALPEPEAMSGEAYAPPENNIQGKLVDIWADVLGVKKSMIGIDASFFQLGGHSLKAAVLVAKIHKQLNIKLLLGEVFRTPTIRGLSENIKSPVQDKQGDVLNEAAEKREYYESSSAQKRFFVLQQMEPGTTSYNLSGMLPLRKGIEKAKIEATFKQLISRHEGLRTSFEVIDKRLVQRVHHEVEFEIEELSAVNIKEFIRPFDLGKTPQMRVGLVEEANQKYILAVDMHHIISDALSNRILLGDFFSLCKGKELPLLQYQYKDYSEWQNREKSREALKQQEDFWLSEFSGEVPILNMPTDFPRPQLKRLEGNRVIFEIGETLTGSLHKLVKIYDVTMYMALLATFYVLLAKLSRQADIVVGTQVLGRVSAELQGIIGPFINTLALRNFPGEEKKFDQFLAEVKERTLKAFENQEFQFEDLVWKLNLERDIIRNPLFDIMFDMNLFELDFNEPPVTGEKPINDQYDLKNPRFGIENSASKMDLIFIAREIEGKIQLNVEYSTGLYKEETIRDFLTLYERIIESVTGNPGITIGDIEGPGDDEGMEEMAVEFDL